MRCSTAYLARGIQNSFLPWSKDAPKFMEKIMRNNFVAKHCRTYNKAVTMRDRTKYRRSDDWDEDYEPPRMY